MLDLTGASDNLRFLAQNYLAYVHNLSLYCHLKYKIPKQVSRGRDSGHIPYPDVFWFKPVLYLDLVSIFQKKGG
jgi:hypothetical protein